MNAKIAVPQEKIAEFCQRYHIHRLSFFGSILRSDFRPDSDVDVLVEFEPNHKIGLLTFAMMQVELGDILGREVHLSTPGFLSDDFRQQIIDTASIQYERA